MSPFLTKSATELARMIRAREATSAAIVDAHIRRVEEVNPRINAVVAERFAQAREEAAHADAEVARGAELPPFHGVPCTIKECFALEGMPQTGGLLARKGRLSREDATGVTRLRQAGAIPLGVTNLSELCMWMESANTVYGRTNNPYDHGRTAGGSSGGEGAIIGAGASPFGLGSDIGGSIRMPAFFNGVFGHKPTGGLIPNSGQWPSSENEALRYQTTGPLARRAEDLWPLVKVLAGPDGIDPACIDPKLGDPSRVDLAQVRVLAVTDNGRIAVEPAMRDAHARAAKALLARGATLVETRIEKLRYSLEIWAAMLGAVDQKTFRALLKEDAPFKPAREIARFALGKSEHTLPAIALALVENIAKASPKQTARFCAMGRELRKELDEALGERGVLLFPSYPTVAPRHNAPLMPPIKWMYTAIFNVLELPVTQVPLGLDDRGLPLGVQVVGPHGGDALTVAVALELERWFGGWVPPDDMVRAPR